MDKKNGLDFAVTREPPLKRKFRLWPHQWIGLPILFAIPILAITGVLGESSEKIEVSTELKNVEISGEYPKRLHYGKSEKIELTLSNNSSSILDEVELHFEGDYLKHFSDVSFTPSVEEGYKLKIKNIKPGESRHVAVSVRGESYGSHSGKIDAVVGDRKIASIDLNSFVFP